jgi:hypothetical protein
MSCRGARNPVGCGVQLIYCCHCQSANHHLSRASSSRSVSFIPFAWNGDAIERICLAVDHTDSHMLVNHSRFCCCSVYFGCNRPTILQASNGPLNPRRSQATPADLGEWICTAFRPEHKSLKSCMFLHCIVSVAIFVICVLPWS